MAQVSEPRHSFFMIFYQTNHRCTEDSSDSEATLRRSLFELNPIDMRNTADEVHGKLRASITDDVPAEELHKTIYYEQFYLFVVEMMLAELGDLTEKTVRKRFAIHLINNSRPIKMSLLKEQVAE